METSEYLQNRWEKEGSYRAKPVAWTIEESPKDDSQSVAIAIQFSLTQQWHGKEQGWSQQWAPGYFSESRSWVIKKDGTENVGAIKALADAGVWDGDWDKLAGPPQDITVIVQVEAKQWDGQMRYRINWINPNADEPRSRNASFQPANSALLTSLRQRFQSKTRAIAGGQQTNAQDSAPAPPPPAAAAAPQQNAQQASSPAAPSAPPAPTPAVQQSIADTVAAPLDPEIDPSADMTPF